MTETAYPLSWPTGWPRTESYRRKDAPFGRTGTWTTARATEELSKELRLLGASNEVLSSNVALRLDGRPRSNTPAPDPGVAVYFTLKKKRLVLACDRWSKVEHNIRAIAAHVNALRGQERWGVGSIEQAFTGYAALPPASTALTRRDFRDVLGLDPGPYTVEDVQMFYRLAAKACHPDAGGSAAEFQELTAARDEALRAIGAAS